ncbi:MAG: hypothetical protein ABRQ23_02035 [Syntrophomonadaceae bacterium]
MLINWFTVIAQIINFLILVWLLKRFLYQPILHAIDAREKYVADKIAAAEADMVAAQEEEAEFKQKNEAFAGQRAELMRQAEDEARLERQRLLENAKKEIEEQRQRWLESMLSNQQTLEQAIGMRAKQEIFAIARKTLRDLASTDLEEHILEQFMVKLRQLKPEDKELLLTTAVLPSQSILVHTGFELTSNQMARLKDVIQTVLAPNREVRFDYVPDQIAGIELLINDRKIAWNIDAYLNSLEDKVGELLSSQIQTQSTARMTSE